MYRKPNRWLVIAGLLIVTGVMLLSSDEPPFPAFEGTFLQGLLVSGISGNDIIFNLSMGIIVSSIFYLIVVYLPEKQKQADIAPQIDQYISEVVSRTCGLVSEIVKYSGADVDLSKITEEKLVDVSKLVNPQQIKKQFHNGGAGTFEAHFGFSCHSEWQHILRNIDDTMRFLPYVDTGVVRILNKIRSSTFSLTVGMLRDIDEIRNSDMSAWAPCIYEVFCLSQELEEYYQDNVNKKFVNPCK